MVRRRLIGVPPNGPDHLNDIAGILSAWFRTDSPMNCSRAMRGRACRPEPGPAQCRFDIHCSRYMETRVFADLHSTGNNSRKPLIEALSDRT